MMAKNQKTQQLKSIEQASGTKISKHIWACPSSGNMSKPLLLLPFSLTDGLTGPKATAPSCDPGKTHKVNKVGHKVQLDGRHANAEGWDAGDLASRANCSETMLRHNAKSALKVNATSLGCIHLQLRPSWVSKVKRFKFPGQIPILLIFPQATKKTPTNKPSIIQLAFSAFCFLLCC